MSSPPPSRSRSLPFLCLFLVGLLDSSAQSSLPADCDNGASIQHIEDLRQFEGNPLPKNATVCVNLAGGSVEEMTSYFLSPISFNLRIIGNNSTVRCSSEDGNGKEEMFALFVNHTELVEISQVHFEGCRWPLYLNLVATIQITSSSFQNFSPRGALEIAHSPNIFIWDSKFRSCRSLGSGKRRFSGNAGGLAIGYSPLVSEFDELQHPTISIVDSVFTNNTAEADSRYHYNVLRVLRDQVYNQRGGGMAFFFGASNYSSEVEITGCMLTGNRAQDSGGGIYMFLGGENSTHSVFISGTAFTANEAMDGGGLEITHSNQYSQKYPNIVVVVNSSFERNMGSFGGGYKNIQLDSQTNLNSLLVKNCTFGNNSATVGAALYLQSVETVEVNPLLKRIILEDSTFLNNDGRRGSVFVIGNVVTVNGTSHFEGNIGPVLRVLGTLVALEGNLSFWNNRHHSEGFSGAIYLSSFGQIILHKYVSISFVNNTGNEGASIVVKGQLIAAAFTRQLYNPQCFLQYIEPTVPPPEWEVSMMFEGNVANVGPVVLMPDSKICEWNNINYPFFADTVRNAWTFMETRNNFVNCAADGAMMQCLDPSRYIQTGVVELQVVTNYTEAYPGQNVEITAMALDQFNHKTSAFVSVVAPDDKSIVFEPRVVSISPLDNEINFQFYGNSSNYRMQTNVSLVPVFTTDMRSSSLILQYQSCLPGYVIDEVTNKCTCMETDVIILCQDNEDGLLLADGTWGASPKLSRTLAYSTCPPNYCHCTGDDTPDLNEGCQYLYNDDNSICSDNRNGIICGRCRDGYGVGLLTNNCRKYGGLPQFWIHPIYVVILVVVLVALVKAGEPLYTVLRGFLLYVQLSPIAVAYFPANYNMKPELMSCIASLFAIYIPYDFSFHKEMTSLEAYGLRLVAPLIAIIVVPLAARFKQHRFKYWHGIWTIILLMFVMTVDTSFSLVYCRVLNYHSGDVSVWFYDGNVRCYRGGHIPLFILALVSVVILFLLILFVSASIYYKTLRKKYNKFEQLERFSIVVTHGIKHEYKWWPIAELGFRYIFVAAVILFPGFVVVPLVLVSIAFVTQTTIHPYKNRAANYFESLFLLWLVGLLGLGNTTALKNSLTGNRSHPLWILLYLPTVFGFILLAVLAVWKIRKIILQNEEKIRSFFKMKFKSRDGFRKHRTDENEGGVTNTVVGLEEDEESSSTSAPTYTAFL